MTVDYCGPEWLKPLADKFNLSCFHRATHIVLQGGDYTDTDVDDLCRLKHLQSISLLRTRITADGLAKLKRSLPDCKIQS